MVNRRERTAGPEADEDDALLAQRPRTRAACLGGPRPCPWVGCRYHLWSDVTAAGGIRAPEADPMDMGETCALDVADRGPQILDAVGQLFGFSRERARQVEEAALAKAAAAGLALEGGP